MITLKMNVTSTEDLLFVKHNSKCSLVLLYLIPFIVQGGSRYDNLQLTDEDRGKQKGLFQRHGAGKRENANK